MLNRVYAVMIGIFWMTAPAFAQSPLTLTYQGELSDLGGTRVSAAYPMTFRLYTSSDESIAIWTETHADVAVVDGVFTVSLGRITELSSIIRHSTLAWRADR